MRRNASSWTIKLLLGLISLSFALFFGYSAFRGGVGGDAAALVADQDIPIEQFQLAYNNAVGRVQENFEEGVPPEMARYLQSTVLNQLIQRKVEEMFARSLGFRVADTEVAAIIRKQQQFYTDGIFNMEYYQKQFRPYYRRRYGLDFEQALRQEILLDMLRAFESNAQLESPEESDWSRTIDQRLWTFEVVSIPDDKLREKVKSVDTADQEIETQLDKWVNAWSRGSLPMAQLKTYNASGPVKKEITLFDRGELLDRPVPPEHESLLLQMKKAGTVYKTPIRLGNDWYLVKLDRLVLNDGETSTATDNDADGLDDVAVSNPIEIFNLWLNEFGKHLRIEKNLSI